MKVYIIEDEIHAQINLKRILKHNFDDIQILGTADSITEAVRWLNNPGNSPDIIFMDVELSDGKCFEIFKRVEVKANVIIITAYDSYAINAFKVNSVDYLLKPVYHKELVEAVAKCRLRAESQSIDISSIESLLKNTKEYKQRFTVKLGDRVIIVPVSDIAYFYSEDKATYIITHQNKRHIIDMSLDSIMPLLDPNNFFRLTRAFIISIGSIDSVFKHLGSRLKVIFNPKPDKDVYVSRVRIPDFLKWLDGEH